MYFHLLPRAEDQALNLLNTDGSGLLCGFPFLIGTWGATTGQEESDGFLVPCKTTQYVTWKHQIYPRDVGSLSQSSASPHLWQPPGWLVQRLVFAVGTEQCCFCWEFSSLTKGGLRDHFWSWLCHFVVIRSYKIARFQKKNQQPVIEKGFSLAM